MTNDVVGGYRLIRKLGEAERAEVYLGYPQSGAGGPSAVKVFRTSAPHESIMTEIEALTRASGPHCIPLTDLATAADGTYALILERVTGGSLARVLASRTRFLVGEAITVLAPIAATLGRLHLSGVVHSRIGPETVLFTKDGAPILVAFGYATLIPPGMPSALLDARAEVIAERDAFAAMARCVLILVRDEKAASLVEWLSSAPRVDDWWEQVETRLFELGDPSALDLSAEAAVDPQPVPTRTITAAPVVEPVGVSPGVLESLGLPTFVLDAVTPRIAQIRASLARVRRPVWLAAGVAAVGLVAAFALVPGDAPEATADSPPSVQFPGESRSRGEISEHSAVTDDDPVAALSELLVRREECIRDVSVLCLDGVDQAGSSALTADLGLVRAVETSGLGAVPAERLVLIERLGDSALVEITSPVNGEPASILLMKGEAGWRIRDYLE